MSARHGQLGDRINLIRQSWRLFRQDTASLLGASAVLFVGSAVVVSIVFGFVLAVRLNHHTFVESAIVLVAAAALIGPLMGGMIGMPVAIVRRHERPKARAIWNGYRQWLGLSAIVFVGEVASTLVQLAYWWSVPWPVRLLAVFGVVLAVLFVYVLPAMVDERLGLSAAVAFSWGLLKGRELWRTTLAVIVLIVAQTLLNELQRASGPFILFELPILLLIAPLTASYIAGMYFRARREDQLVDEATGKRAAVQPSP